MFCVRARLLGCHSARLSSCGSSQYFPCKRAFTSAHKGCSVPVYAESGRNFSCNEEMQILAWVVCLQNTMPATQRNCFCDKCSDMIFCCCCCFSFISLNLTQNTIVILNYAVWIHTVISFTCNITYGSSSFKL